MENNNIKLLIVPDVHCREFWKEPVKEILENYKETRIIFLGDYLDGYDYEWDKNDDYAERGVNNFTDIIELKKKYPERITLLIGNHDCSYAVSKEVCECRTDYKNEARIVNLFTDNRKLFKVADEELINEKHFIFSHSGIHKEYAKMIFEDVANEENIVSLLNNAWDNEDDNFLRSLGLYSYYRGWGGYDFGSVVWADLREWKTNEDMYGYMVFGHTQLEKKPIINNKIACLDVRKTFIIDDEGNIKEW